MKEIISIQVGGYANFVGSHFWNIQDELLGLQNYLEADSCFLNSGVNFDVLYRVGETTQGLATYTPRLLTIDARGSLGAVKAIGSLYEQPPSLDTTSVTSWKGQVSKHISEPHAKNEFLQSLEQEELAWNCQQEGKQPTDSSDESVNRETALLKSLEDSVQFWTDYSKVHFHPQSLFELEGVWHETTPLDDYGSGKGILTGLVKEDALDRLRFFVEEADHLQGLQVLVDDSNGFAAVATELLEEVANDYNKNQILLFTIRPPSSLRRPSTFRDSTVRGLHDAISFSELSTFSSYTIPLGLSSFSGMSKYLQVDDTRNFHTSAVYAAALSCTTLPLRMDLSGQTSSTLQQMAVGRIDMGSLIQLLLGQMGRRVSMLNVAMPAPPIPGLDKLEAVDYSRFQPLISGVIEMDDQLASESIVVQGALSADLGVPASVQDMLNCFSGKRSRFYHFAASLCPLAVPLPFPDLFAPLKGSKRPVTEMRSNFSSIPIATMLSASAAMLPYLERRLLSLRQPGGGSLGWQILEGWGFQKDDIQELCELTSNVVAAYGSTMVESASDSE